MINILKDMNFLEIFILKLIYYEFIVFKNESFVYFFRFRLKERRRDKSFKNKVIE